MPFCWNDDGMLRFMTSREVFGIMTGEACIRG